MRFTLLSRAQLVSLLLLQFSLPNFASEKAEPAERERRLQEINAELKRQKAIKQEAEDERARMQARLNEINGKLNQIDQKGNIQSRQQELKKSEREINIRMEKARAEKEQRRKQVEQARADLGHKTQQANRLRKEVDSSAQEIRTRIETQRQGTIELRDILLPHARQGNKKAIDDLAEVELMFLEVLIAAQRRLPEFKRLIDEWTPECIHWSQLAYKQGNEEAGFKLANLYETQGDEGQRKAQRIYQELIKSSNGTIRDKAKGRIP